MGTVHRTGCVLCPQNCGLEAEVENNRIVKVRPDKGNVRSEGYACRKGLNIAYHEHHADRPHHHVHGPRGALGVRGTAATRHHHMVGEWRRAKTNRTTKGDAGNAACP